MSKDFFPPRANLKRETIKGRRRRADFFDELKMNPSPPSAETLAFTPDNLHANAA
jgi:hypothetical protein